MRYDLINLRNQKEISLRLPCGEADIQRCCDALGLKNDIFARVYVSAVTDHAQLDNMLGKAEHNLDELNYLEKRLDSLGEGEMPTFYATATAMKMRQVRDLINLTFNTHCYSLLADFRNLNELGKSLYLNEHGKASVDFLKELNGQKYIEDMIRNNSKPFVSPTGFIYPNSNEPQQVYNGRCFPLYMFEANPITVCLSTKFDKDYLYLPCEKELLNHFVTAQDKCAYEGFVSQVLKEIPKQIVAFLALKADTVLIDGREYEYGKLRFCLLSKLNQQDMVDLLLAVVDQCGRVQSVRKYVEKAVYNLSNVSNIE